MELIAIRRMLPGLACVAGLLGLVHGGGSCGAAQRLNEQAYRQYHASRMQAIADAVVTRNFSPEKLADYRPPLVCRDRTERAYRQVLQASKQQARSEQDLLQESVTAVDLLDRLIEALVGRDVPRIERLAPELLQHRQRMLALQATLRAKQGAVDSLLGELALNWRRLWPECDLQFQLQPYLDRSWTISSASVANTDLPVLRHYYDSVYTRLAMTYLGYRPAVEPDPEPVLPPGAQRLDVSLDQLEAALRARFDLDQAIEIDAAQLDELAGSGLVAKDWNTGVVNHVALAKERAGAALARLKLLKLADELLTQCLAAEQHEVDWQWRHAWPGIDRETDILRYARQTPKPRLDSPGTSDP